MSCKSVFLRWIGCRFCWLLLLVPVFAQSAEPAKVFPVLGLFFDEREDSKLDPLFREFVRQQSRAILGQRIYDAMVPAFGARVGRLDQRTAGNTFAVSFHITRANSFVVDKGNGNSDVVVTLTGGVYFTNVISGEILTTLSRSVISRAVVARQADLANERRGLFVQAFETLLVDLTTEAPKHFNPVIIETQLTDRQGSLLVFDAGFKQGISAGDRLEDTADNLVDIVYAAENYAVGRMVFDANLSLGSTFQKFNAHPASGKDRPRVAVVVESLPTGYGKDYIARMFSEFLGDAAPLSVVQVNTGFTQLLSTVREQDGVLLSSMKPAERQPPRFLIRLRIPEPVFYETGTNLDFEKQRYYESRAFADVIDNTGRVIFSAVGVDVIKDKIVRGIGPGPDERREVVIKNALTDLGKKLAQIGEVGRDRAEIVSVGDSSLQINSQGRVYSERQQGVVLQKSSARVGKEKREILMPLYEASVKDYAGQKTTTLSIGLPIDTGKSKATAGNVFETLRVGTAPRSAASLAACGPVESLGNSRTPALMEMMSAALGQRMPGMLYAPEAVPLTDGVIGEASGFVRKFPWNQAPIVYCIQPVERVNVGAEQCAAQCDRQIQARYTLRIKKGEEIISRTGFESQYKSTGYYGKSTASDQVIRMLAADVMDEAFGLLQKSVEKLVFPPP